MNIYRGVPMSDKTHEAERQSLNDTAADHGYDVCPDCGNGGVKIDSTGYVPCTRFLTCWSDQPDEPQEDDAFLSPAGQLGAQTSVAFAGKHLGTFDGDDAARKALRDAMDAAQYWPNVWTVSDHGNVQQTTL